MSKKDRRERLRNVLGVSSPAQAAPVVASVPAVAPPPAPKPQQTPAHAGKHFIRRTFADGFVVNK